MRGKFIVIVGPSASGKTELVKALVKRVPNSARLVTTTTRERRPGEKDDYFFTSREEFEKGIAAGEFFEYAEVYGNFYGCSKKVLDDFRAKFEYVFAIIDIQGAETLRRKIHDAFVIFIRSGSLDEIKARLIRARGGVSGISKEELEKRLDTAAQELSLASTFDAIVENREGHFAETVEGAINIIKNPR